MWWRASWIFIILGVFYLKGPSVQTLLFGGDDLTKSINFGLFTSACAHWLDDILAINSLISLVIK